MWGIYTGMPCPYISWFSKRLPFTDHVWGARFHSDWDFDFNSTLTRTPNTDHSTLELFMTACGRTSAGVGKATA